MDYISMYQEINKMIQELRNTALQEADVMSTKRRFGLFSQPITTAIGDDSLYRTKLHQRDQSGKPQTQPRGMPTQFLLPWPHQQPCLPRTQRSLLGGRQETAQGITLHLQPRKEGAEFLPRRWHQRTVRCTSCSMNLSYQYYDEKNPELNPKRHRDVNGKVRTQNRNVQTNPQSKVVAALFKNPQYIIDPYQRLNQANVELNRISKTKEFEAKFRPNSFSPSTFQKDRSVYGMEAEINKVEKNKIKYNMYPHEVAWRRSSPPKSGIVDTIEKFPEYMPNPPQQRLPKSPTKEKQAFRRMSVATTIPSPSIALQRTNLMKQHNFSFTHRQ